jgi:hypothetical protein
VRSTPPDIGAEFDAAKAKFVDRAVEFGHRHAEVLQRHRAHAHQPIRMLGNETGDMVVDHMAAVARDFGRRRIDEVAGIGRDHLDVDAVPIHVGQASLKIGQFRKIDLAALRLNAPGEIVDMGVGVRGFATAGNPGSLQHHGVGLGHHAVAVDIDGAPAFGAAGVRRCAALIGRRAACLALKQHRLFLFRGRRSRRAFAHDQENGVLVLGAVPMHLFAEMRDEAAGRQDRISVPSRPARCLAGPQCNDRWDGSAAG